MAKKKHMHPCDLSDEILEECFDGSTRPELVRKVINTFKVLKSDNTIDPVEFGRNFMYELQGFTNGDDEADENNFDWGVAIAENINEATKL
ncbi:hypothetical protein [Limnohabitans sp. MMS-10A-178]|uniref:hypothetical protein n=1 Tax=Limnohabitans sp. MMS-10A-178 TaxID=1835767 RepID=UPI000D3A5061|nr:hypothetical protein [Limnohabitans sp. MMS-10A-178]PUE13756.1 hypothetical protein B9Z32_13995 [Limnohabitans sp. MMS-10A-178]